MRYFLLIIITLYSLMSQANRGLDSDNMELRKKITKTFDCPVTKMVSICNTYGNCTVVIYAGNQVKFDIDVISKADSKSKAQDELDRVSIVFNDASSKVTAKTVIENKSSWFNWNWSWSGNSELKINYTIYIPDGRPLELDQTYGNIYMPNYSGSVTMDVAYGNIEVADLSGQLKLDLSYGNGKFGCIKNATMDVDYSDLTINSASNVNLSLQYGDFHLIETCESLNLDTDYADLNIGQVNRIKGSGGYNHYKINQCGDLTMDNEYGDVKIDLLKGNVNVNSDYHTTVIDNMTSNVKEVNIYGDYSTLKAASTDGYNYHVAGSYTSVKAPSVQSTDDDDDKIHKGTKKGTRTSTMIKVIGDYTHVTLK